MATRSESPLCSVNENLELSGMNNGSSVHKTINADGASLVVDDEPLRTAACRPRKTRLEVLSKWICSSHFAIYSEVRGDRHLFTISN